MHFCTLGDFIDSLFISSQRNPNHVHRVVIEKLSSREEIQRIETSIIYERVIQRDMTNTLNLVQTD